MHSDPPTSPSTDAARPSRDALDASAPPGSWAPAHRALRSLTRPVEAFLATEAAGGAVLVLATAVALVWANSPWRASYHALWATPVGVHLGALALEAPLRFLVDEVLMTVFFFVVGLEIRREIARGELSEPRRAALPLAAALGGMIVPAAIYAALNAGRTTAGGWGVPMATDIAFAVGALTILGRRVPPALRILLLALAVIDDVGAIIVIGLFYATGFSIWGLLVAAAGMLLVLVLQRVGARRPFMYVLPGAIVWLGLHEAGIHATLAGVVVGLMTPTVAWVGRDAFVDVAGGVVDDVRRRGGAELDAHELDALAAAGREAVAPVDALQSALHGVVALGVMPIFALANAGVTFADVTLDVAALPLLSGIVLGLVVGKPIGILGGSWLATRLGWASLPSGVTWRGVLVVGMAGGIGFTMSLFIADLAFHEADHDAAKVAILVGSLVAAVLTIGPGAWLLPAAPAATGGARTESEAERSTSD